MKTVIITFLTLMMMSASSCKNNNRDKQPDPGTKAPLTLADSLMKEIDEGHIIGMSKMSRLHKAQQQVQQLIDSLTNLPGNLKRKSADYLTLLNETLQDLNYADFAMDKWMTEFSMDSAVDNMEARLNYLKEEKMKVGKMKEKILTSLQKADSVINVLRSN